jgi:hypothetical protein
VSITAKTTIPGPVDLVFAGLPGYTSMGCPLGCGVVDAEFTYCDSTKGADIIELSSGDLQPGQALSGTFGFVPGQTPGSPTSKFDYSPVLLSGKPSQ